jgi:hypothetical protein
LLYFIPTMQDFKSITPRTGMGRVNASKPWWTVELHRHVKVSRNFQRSSRKNPGICILPSFVPYNSCTNHNRSLLKKKRWPVVIPCLKILSSRKSIVAFVLIALKI